jgi:hypothetical protein
MKANFPTQPTAVVTRWLVRCQFIWRSSVMGSIRRSGSGLSIGIIAVLLLTGCANNIVVTGSVPTPLVKKIPAHIGIYYPQSFRTFRYEEKIARQGHWKVELGVQNLGFFRNLMGAMFATVDEVGEPPLAAAVQAGLDGVLVPEILKYAFLTPGISGLNFYSASIHYRLTLLDANGAKAAEWTVVGYGKSEAAAFGENAALAEATMLAIRDGGARIAVDLVKQQGVAQWLAALPGQTVPEASQPVSSAAESPEKS